MLLSPAPQIVPSNLKIFQNLNTTKKSYQVRCFPEDISAFQPGLIVLQPKYRVLTQGLLFTLLSWIPNFPGSHVVFFPFLEAYPIIVFAERL